MEIISSKANSKIQDAKKLLDKKHRDKTGLFLVETKKVIQEAISCGLRPVCLFILQDKQNIFDGFESVYFVKDSALKELSSTVTTDGYIAVFEQKRQTKEYNSGRFLILDNLQNPDNFGAIMRTALACDFKQIFCINCADQYNPKTLRASMGNQFKLDIINISYEDITLLFKNATIYTASMQGENIFLKTDFPQNCGFVIGNEGRGVSEQIKALVKNTLCLPMENNTESLNASISASVIMYYIYSQKYKV